MIWKWQQVCQELAPIVSNVAKSSSHVIIAGDFNIHINERSEFQKYFDLFVTDLP